MRCLIHDFGGYPFPVQLSRELASLGHQVTHVYPTGLPGPKGRLTKGSVDSQHFQIQSVPLSGHFRKYSPHRRFVTQRKYASDIKKLIRHEKPDVILSGNTPIDIQAELLWHCRRNQVAFVHWVQDVYCEAIEFVLRRKLRVLGKPLSIPFRNLEKTVAARSDATIVISPNFRNLLTAWGVPSSQIVVLENWAPLDELAHLPRRNAWSASHGLDGEVVLLYSGTLGLKHRPDLIYRLAEELGSSCKVVVVSEGVGRAYLEQLPPLKNLLLLDFQPYERVSEVLASADVLLATLESDAGQFAVPSKILSYLCAGRPLLFAAPQENLAAKVVERSGGGIVVSSDDPSAWIEAAKKLISVPEHRAEMAANARRYAEQKFNIREIAVEFEEVLGRAIDRRLH